MARTRALPTHDILTRDEIRLLNELGLIKVAESTNQASLDRHVIGERIAKELHTNARIDDASQLADSGRTIEALAAIVCGTDGEIFTDDGRAEIIRVMSALFSPKPDGQVQGPLAFLEPASWLVKARVERSGVANGFPFSATVTVFAVSSNVDVIVAYDITSRAARARRAAATRKTYDVALVQRIPATAPEIMAATLWNAEVYQVEAADTRLALEAGMNSRERKQFAAAVDRRIVEYREQEALAQESERRALEATKSDTVQLPD